MTQPLISDELQELAIWLEEESAILAALGASEAIWQSARKRAEKVRSLAERCRGMVLVPIRTKPTTSGKHVWAWVRLDCEVMCPSDVDPAFALQSKLDGQAPKDSRG